MYKSNLFDLNNLNPKYSMLLYLLLIFTILAFIISFSFFKVKQPSQNKQLVFKTNSDIYDKEYADMYDMITNDFYRTQKELDTVLSTTSNNSIVLDLGSGTGYHVNELNQKGVRAIGIDNSRAMINYSKKYPYQYREGNMLDSDSFYNDSFTHITCFYYTLYYVQNKQQLFNNAYKWLTTGGIFIVEMTKSCTYGTPSIHNDKYMYKRTIKGNKVYETITRGKKVRKNEHNFYIEPIQDIVTMAENVGFSVVSNETYKNNVIYTFKKLD
jgi:ubiquinone/menaquinone biosynthesis C-methylase UbiE